MPLPFALSEPCCMVRWQAISMASGRPEDAAAAALETVSYAQMLVLFAPQAVPAIAHLPLLLDTLPSRQPSLRRWAAALPLLSRNVIIPSDGPGLTASVASPGS